MAKASITTIEREVVQKVAEERVTLTLSIDEAIMLQALTSSLDPCCYKGHYLSRGVYLALRNKLGVYAGLYNTDLYYQCLLEDTWLGVEQKP